MEQFHELCRAIDALSKAVDGSQDLDQIIIRWLNPKKPAFGTAYHFTRSLGAMLPGEKIVKVERFPSGRWRAWMKNEWSADGNTEILARRLAHMTFVQSEIRAGNTEFSERPIPANQYQMTKPDNFHDEALAEPPHVTIGALESGNEVIIIDALCSRIRELQKARVVKPPPNAPRLIAHDGESSIKTYADRRCDPVITDAGRKSEATMEDAISVWYEEARPRVKNLDRVSRTIRRFTEMHQNRILNTYTKAEVREFLLNMQKMPRHAPLVLKGKSMPIILKYMEQNPGLELVTPKTINSYLKDLYMIFNWAMASDLCAANPASNLRIVDGRNKTELRVPYDLEDLKMIFERSPMYSGCLSSRSRFRPGNRIIKDALFWFPLFGLYSGARLGEIAQAEVGDFKSTQGIHYLDIHAAGANRHLKTQSSDRRIPIHPELIHIGFLEYLRDQKERGYVRAFEKIEGRRNVCSPSSWSRTWTIYQRNMGFADKRKVFHSFRHTFKYACRDAGLEEEVHDSLTGHRPFQSGRSYGGRISLSILAKAVARVRYPGLDLSNLYHI